MTNNNPNPQAQQPMSRLNPALAPLNALMGEWKVVGSHPLAQFSSRRSRLRARVTDSSATGCGTSHRRSRESR